MNMIESMSKHMLSTKNMGEHIQSQRLPNGTSNRKSNRESNTKPFIIKKGSDDDDITIENENEQQPTHTHPVSETWTLPSQPDSLFWCFIIMSKGVLNYNMMEHKYKHGNCFTDEKTMKYELIEQMRIGYKKQVSPHKLGTTLNNLESCLAYEKKLNISTTLSLCALKCINVCYITRGQYFILDPLLQSDVCHVIRLSDRQKSKYECLQIEKSELPEYIGGKIRIENLLKPFKSVTAYTVKQLVDFCTVLKIDPFEPVTDTGKNTKTKKNKKKQELYTEITNAL
jgi:hypothetical protein